MDRFAQYMSSATKLRKLNECRMFLKVNTLSEISSADGARIDDWAWKGEQSSLKLNDYQWPRTPHKLPGNLEKSA
jgi:hypothetical protein